MSDRTEEEAVARYRNPESPLTLAEGLHEFETIHAEALYHRDLSEDARTFFRRHDIAHVVFGCDTSLLNEGLVKLWTAFGSTLGFRGHLREYARRETIEIAGALRPADVVVTFFRSLVLFPRVLFRCRSMRKKWPWADHEAHLDRPLAEIRREYGIRPIVTD